MGLFDKVVKLATAGPQKEALSILQESLAALGGKGMSPEAKLGATAAFTEIMAALKRRKLASPEVEEEARRMVALFGPIEDAPTKGGSSCP